MYTLTDLGVLPGYVSSEAHSVNRHGEVVGFCSTGPPFGSYVWKNARAFYWANGQMTDLGTLGGYSVASSINDYGTVVGYSTTSNGDEHAFQWTKAAGMIDLELDGPWNGALWINNNGTIVGYYRGTASTFGEGFIRSNTGAVQTLSGVTSLSPDGEAIQGGALAINEKDQVAGWLTNSKTIVVLWDNGNLTELGFPFVWCTGIDAGGNVLGLGVYGDVIWSAGEITTLQPLVGYAEHHEAATAIGEDRVVVGYAFNETVYDNPRAVVWFSVWPIDLNSLIDNNPEFVASYAFGINKLGDIVGAGFVNGQSHAFLARPPHKFLYGPKKLFPGFLVHPSGIQVSGGVKVGGPGIGITPDGRVFPIPSPSPDPMVRAVTQAYAALAMVKDPEVRNRLERKIADAIEKEIKSQSGT